LSAFQLALPLEPYPGAPTEEAAQGASGKDEGEEAESEDPWGPTRADERGRSPMRADKRKPKAGACWKPAKQACWKRSPL